MTSPTVKVITQERLKAHTGTSGLHFLAKRGLIAFAAAFKILYAVSRQPAGIRRMGHERPPAKSMAKRGSGGACGAQSPHPSQRYEGYVLHFAARAKVLAEDHHDDEAHDVHDPPLPSGRAAVEEGAEEQVVQVHRRSEVEARAGRLDDDGERAVRT